VVTVVPFLRGATLTSWMRSTLSDTVSQSPTRDAGALEAKLGVLLERHRSGDAQAMDLLMEALFPTVRRFIFRLCRPQETQLRDDLVQTALIEVFRLCARFEGRSRFTSFALGICCQVMRHHRRRDRLRWLFRKTTAEVLTPQEPASAETLLDTRRETALARARLERLGFEERTVFVLHEMDELAQDEIAVILGCSTRTVKRKLRSARAQLCRENP
jgi:RNA polymerase sigma-70 factor (ECF subfamily)